MTSRRVLFSAQRNEGPFLLEWIAYHKVVGFTDIVVYSNACTDGSDELLDNLAETGEVVHVRHQVPEDASPQLNASRLFLESGFLRQDDWVMWLDTDEYLCVRVGEGHVDDLIAELPEAAAIGVAWRVFGSAGAATWPGEQIAQPFVRASRRQWPPNTQIKTLFRYGPHIRQMHLHRPVFAFRVPAEEIAFFGSDGNRLDHEFIHHRMPRGYPRHRLPRGDDLQRLAQVNHYSVRTPDLYALKRLRGRGLASRIDTGVRHDDEFFATYDTNQFEDAEILRHLDAKRAEIARLEGLIGKAAWAVQP